MYVLACIVVFQNIMLFLLITHTFKIPDQHFSYVYLYLFFFCHIFFRSYLIELSLIYLLTRSDAELSMDLEDASEEVALLKSTKEVLNRYLHFL